MRIVHIGRITGRGHVLISDEPFLPAHFANVRGKRKIRICDDSRCVELTIMGAEALLKTGGKEVWGFLVPFVEDEATLAFLENREFELI